MSEPSVSVLIATRDRAESLRGTLDLVRRQTLPRDAFEVIVVDNGSTDHTADVLAEASSGLPVRRLVEPIPGKNRALNRGLVSTRGRWLVFTDDDVLPEPDWLAEILRGGERWPECTIVGGRVSPAYPAETPPWMKRHLIAGAAFSSFDLGDAEHVTTRTPFGPNMAIRRDAMGESRFDEGIGPAAGDYAMGSESELLLRLMDRGHPVLYAPRARVQHVIRPEQLTERWLARRAYRFGRGQERLRLPHDWMVDPWGGLGRGARIKALLRLLGSRLSSRQRRIEASWVFHYLRGVAAEARSRR